ncbi:Flp family type IVb pilin [Asticcacaulis machinosus]|uniref:Flp family type IVb pilin n=1 Tax=Asticcacaulis machinosus TaxID=2984211 RepID=A0ABT5HND8_9CAUL|nr:Flp family type IVb pilin [Asticcacaulis machinosus]MDC7677124.1 Flp family type IVb pilin [Asticcacaulis machinosus]
MIKAFIEDERGATAIEYGLIAALMFLVVATAISQVADENEKMYDKISASIEEVTSRTP